VGSCSLGREKSKKVHASQSTWPSGVDEQGVSTGGTAKLPACRGEPARGWGVYKLPKRVDREEHKAANY